MENEEMDLKKIMDDKVQEAEVVYRMLGIQTSTREPALSEIPSDMPDSIPERSNDKELEFHWTRLSISSSIGCISE
jgi:hypothetical protein